MADQQPADVLDVDEARLAAASPPRAAIVLGRVLNPPYVVAFLLIAVTLTSTQDLRTASWVLAVSLVASSQYRERCCGWRCAKAAPATGTSSAAASGRRSMSAPSSR